VTYAVQVLDSDGNTTTEHRFIFLSRAVKRYARMLARHKGTHVRLVELDTLPALPPKILAEHFDTRRNA
jgi:hypothetical protein